MDVRDMELTFPVVTAEAFPHGLRCAHTGCDRLIEDGQPFVTHVTQVWTNGDVLGHLACVYCACAEPLVAAVDEDPYRGDV